MDVAKASSAANLASVVPKGALLVKAERLVKVDRDRRAVGRAEKVIASAAANGADRAENVDRVESVDADPVGSVESAVEIAENGADRAVVPVDGRSISRWISSWKS